ncbi:polyketide cyclase [Pseudonocardiaceae bacterium YIM PH 21723]|nr:polyketide cyclase [Pseudonocardiaceae bacterium YIM PH 21723]
MTAENSYSFVSTWNLTGTIDEVEAIFDEPARMPVWWPSVYLDVTQLEPGDERGVGRVISIYSTGWLPYTLKWKFKVTERTGTRSRFEAWGDFAGWGGYELSQHGNHVQVVWNWHVQADKPLLASLSWLLKPIFAANHEWAMRQGHKAIGLELARRRALSPAELALIPSPQPRSKPLLLGGVVVAAATGTFLWLRRR